MVMGPDELVSVGTAREVAVATPSVGVVNEGLSRNANVFRAAPVVIVP